MPLWLGYNSLQGLGASKIKFVLLLVQVPALELLQPLHLQKKGLLLLQQI